MYDGPDPYARARMLRDLAEETNSWTMKVLVPDGYRLKSGVRDYTVRDLLMDSADDTEQLENSKYEESW